MAAVAHKSMVSRGLGVFLAAGLALSFASTAFADGEGGAGGNDDPPPPPPDEEESLPTSGLSDTETSYKGAIMLRGNHEVTMESVVPGYVGEEWYQADGRYAYFSGNTLYAGVQDDENNYVDMIAEFFWFESSIERGSDFYVAVVKARTSPNLQDWRLEDHGNGFLGYFVPDNEATLYLRAQTDVTAGSGAFRWDWSVPFDNYGWDAYGNITMETKYGLGINGEGAAQKAYETPEGSTIPVEANVQAKGFFNSDYQVQTKYEVTLWRWEIVVHGSAGQIDWQMNLHSKDRENQNAYHEYFIAMQSDQGVPFKLDWLEVGGSVKKPVALWWDEHRSLSAAVTGLVLRPPQLPPPPPTDDGEENDNGEDGTGGAPPTDDGPADQPGAPSQPSSVNNFYERGCALGGSSNGDGWLALGALGLLLGLRRRR